MTDDQADWRLSELARLGASERQMSHDLMRAREAIAALVKELLPHHAPAKLIEDVVRASGYSRTLVEAIRGGRDMWSASR
jgi:hypothetical protein